MRLSRHLNWSVLASVRNISVHLSPFPEAVFKVTVARCGGADAA
jgi:hypothetical protein